MAQAYKMSNIRETSSRIFIDIPKMIINIFEKNTDTISVGEEDLDVAIAKSGLPDDYKKILKTGDNTVSIMEKNIEEVNLVKKRENGTTSNRKKGVRRYQKFPTTEREDGRDGRD